MATQFAHVHTRPLPPHVVPRRRTNATRKLVIQTAQRLFQDRSYDAVSMDAVAEAAGVTRRTIYNHFADRAELFIAVREREMLALSGCAQIAVPTDRPAPVALVFFAERAAELLGDSRLVGFVRSIFKDGAAQPWMSEAYHQNVRAPLQQSLEIYLHRLSRSGEMAIEDIGRAAQQFLGLIEARVMLPRLMHLDGVDVPSPACIAQDVTELFLLTNGGTVSRTHAMSVERSVSGRA